MNDPTHWANRLARLQDANLVQGLPYFVVLLFTTLYVSTLATFPIPGDPLEFVAASHSLGVAHPSGYPLYILLGKIWQLLLFFVDPVIVMGLASLVYWIAALVLIISILRELEVHPIWSSCVVLALGSIPDLWRYTAYPEVYTLHALMAALLCWSLVRFHQRPSESRLWTCGLVAGLSLGNHMTAVLLFPGLGLWMLLNLRTLPAEASKIRALLGFALIWGISSLIPLSIYFLDRPDALNYIDQFHNEYPDLALDTSWQRIWWMISAQQYGATLSFGDLFNAQYLANVVEIIKRVSLQQPFLSACSGFALLALPLAKRPRLPASLKLFLVLSIGLQCLYFATYLWAFEAAFFAQSYVMLGIILGVGLQYLLKEGAPAAVWLGGILMYHAFLVSSIYSEVKPVNSGYPLELVEEFSQLPADAVVFSTWDKSTIFWYAQWVRDINPNILIFNALPPNWEVGIKRYADRPHYFESLPPELPAQQFERRGAFFQRRPDRP